MPPRRKPRTLREKMQRANKLQPLEAKRRGGLNRWQAMTDEQRAELVDKLKAATAARRARAQDSPEVGNAEN